MEFLALCGSLRAASINAMLLRAASRLTPVGISVEFFADIGALPLFNPDLETDPPLRVRNLHHAVARADALIIASPEYAHGVTGTIKNALDWLVSFELFVDKPVAVFNSSPRAHHADDALRETLKTMSAAIVETASMSWPLLGSQLNEDDLVLHPQFANEIQAALESLRQFAQERRASGPTFAL